jgi:multidrug efflux pump subunit AcrB
MSAGIGPAGKIARFFIDSKLTPLIVIGALILGAFAVSLTPREEEPQIVVPIVDIFVALGGASPEEVENRVTIPLEKRMWEIPGVEYVYSASMPGVSMVTVRFLVGAEMEPSLIKLYDKLAGGLDRMPEGASPPLVKLRSIDDVPVLALTLWSHSYDWFQLRRIGAELGREISAIGNIADIRLTGGQRRQISVLLDKARMAAFELDPGRISSALRMQNATQPAGAFEELDREVLVETGAFLENVDELRDLVVGVHRGKPVYLRDVADVRDGPEEVADYVYFAHGPAGVAAAEGADDAYGVMPAVTLSIAKRQGADAERVVKSALEKVESLKGRVIPPGVEVTVTRDYGETSSEKARELLTHLIGAILSVTVVIAIFLGWRGAAVVFISVPVTFALTLFVYYIFGYTLNRVTLFALIFVTGIVVDDSIIVVENIVRHFQMRKVPPMQAAIAAVAEVGNPTILATLTVIAAVLPMAFVRGLMGPYMRPMPVGAALAMVFSLLIALVAAPWFAYRLVKGEGHGEESGYALEKTLTYRVYRKLLVPLLVRPLRAWLALLAVFVMLLLAVAMFPLKIVQVKMLPFDNKSEVQVIIDMPEGTTLERTAQVAQEIGVYLQTVREVTDLQVYAGTAAPVNFNGLVRHYDLRRGSNVADLQVNLVHKSERPDQSHAFAKRIRPSIQEIALRHGAAVKVAEIPPGPPVLATLVSEVYGPTEEVRVDVARKVLEIYRSTEGVVDVDWLVEAPQPKRVLRVDREKAALHGVPAAEVVRALRLAMTGEKAGTLHDAKEAEPVSIELRLPREDRSNVEDLSKLRVASMSGALVPLSELIRVEETTLARTRHRKNLRPVVYVIGDVAGATESPVYALLDMGDRIDELEVPGGGGVEQLFSGDPASLERSSMKWDGEWQITYEVFRDLGISFGVVLVLIYVLIIGWFQSFKVPLVMMIAIPLSLVGILPGHWMLGAFFTATSMIGFIALAGIMVRNSVLLIDFVDQTLERGATLGEAVLEAGAVRFRPILLTAGTVVVGALVILFDPIFEGLAISLLFGAIASTVLTLLVVPLVHFMVEKRKYKTPVPTGWSAEKATKS